MSKESPAGDAFLQQLLPAGVSLLDSSKHIWITEHPRSFLVLQLQQLAGIAGSFCRVSLWSDQWERLSADASVAQQRLNHELKVLVFDLDWGLMWLQRVRCDEAVHGLDAVIVRMEVMNASNSAAVQVVHLPILLRDGKHAAGLFQDASKVMERPIALWQANTQATTNVMFKELRTSGQSLVVQRRMLASASKLVLQGRALTCPGLNSGWELLTAPNLGPLEFAAEQLESPVMMVVPRVYATVVGLHIGAQELLAGSDGWCKVYASAEAPGQEGNVRMSLLGQFSSDSQAGTWVEMAELELPSQLPADGDGIDVRVVFTQLEDRVGKRGTQEGLPAEKWVAQAVLHLDNEHLEVMTTSAAAREDAPTYYLPTGTYELPLRIHGRAHGSTDVPIGLVQLRLASFAATPRSSWWAPDGLITLVHTEPSEATFLAFLGALQRCNPQQGDAIFGAATPVDILLCFPKLLEHLRPLNDFAADSPEFVLGCTALSILLGYLTDDVMAHPSVAQRAMMALSQTLYSDTLTDIVAHLSNTILPKAKQANTPTEWQRVRGLCWLMSEVLRSDGDDSENDVVLGCAERALGELCTRLRSSWQAELSLAKCADAIGAAVCLSMLLRAALDAFPTGLVVQQLLPCFPPQQATPEFRHAFTLAHCAGASLLAQLMNAMQPAQISALCNEYVSLEGSDDSTTLAYQLSRVAARVLLSTFELVNEGASSDSSDKSNCADHGFASAAEWLVQAYLKYLSTFPHEQHVIAATDIQPIVEPAPLPMTPPTSPVAKPSPPTPPPTPPRARDGLPPPPPALPRRRQRSVMQLAATTTSTAAATTPFAPTRQMAVHGPQQRWLQFASKAELYVQGGLVDVLASCVGYGMAGNHTLRSQSERLLAAFIDVLSEELLQLSAVSGARTPLELHGQLRYLIHRGAGDRWQQQCHVVVRLFRCLDEVLACPAIVARGVGNTEQLLTEHCSLLLFASETIDTLHALDPDNNGNSSIVAFAAAADRLPLTLIVRACRLILPFAQHIESSDPAQLSVLLSCLSILAAQLRAHAPYLRSALAENFSLRLDMVVLTHWVLAVVHTADKTLRQRISTSVSAELLLALKIPLLYVFDIVSSSDVLEDDLGNATRTSTLEAYLQAMVQSLTVRRVSVEDSSGGGTPQTSLLSMGMGGQPGSSKTEAPSASHLKASDLPSLPAADITIATFKQYVALYQSLLYGDDTVDDDDDDNALQPGRVLDLATDQHDIGLPCKWTRSVDICSPGTTRSDSQLFDICNEIRNVFMVTERDATNLVQYMSCKDGSKKDVGATLCRAALLECRITMLQERFSMVLSLLHSPTSAPRQSDNLSESILDQLQQCVAVWHEAFGGMPHAYHEVPYRVWQLKLQVASFQERNGEVGAAKRVEVIEQYHEALRRLLAAMVTEGKWESVRELVGLVRPQYENTLTAVPRVRTLFQELKRFQDGVVDYLGRHGECRCLPVHFAVYLSKWPWQAESANLGDAGSGDAGVWLLIKSDPVQSLSSQGAKSSQKFTLPSQSGYHAVLQRLRKWFPDYRLMPPGAVQTQHGGQQSLYMQLYHAVPRFARSITSPRHGRNRIVHTADATMPSRPAVHRTASFASSIARTNSMRKDSTDVPQHGRQLSVDTVGLGLYDIPETNTDNGRSNSELAWHQLDLASAFTVYIEHRRRDGSDSTSESANDYFGVLAVELTAQTSNSSFCLEPWSSPLILAEASKPAVVSALDASLSVHSYGVHCLEWLSNALETIANEKGTKDKDTGVCSMQAIRDSLIATLELSLHVPPLSPLGMHSTPLLAAEMEDKLDTMWREQRRAMRKALIRTTSMSGADMAGASSMDAVKLQVAGDLPDRIAEAREMYIRHKQAIARALSLLRAPKGPQQPLTPPSLSSMKAAPVKRSAADKQQSDWNEEVCLWLESMFSVILDDCEETAVQSSKR